MMRWAAKTVTEACGVPELPVLTLGMTLPSQIHRLSTSWDSKWGFTTDILGSTPARHEPTLWAPPFWGAMRTLDSAGWILRAPIYFNIARAISIPSWALRMVRL